MKVVETLADLVACLGEEVAVSDWLAVTQERIDRFADRHRGPPVDTRRCPACCAGAVWPHRRARLPGAVADCRLRMHMTLLAAEPVDGNGRQLTWSNTIAREGQDKPVCVASASGRVADAQAVR